MGTTATSGDGGDSGERIEEVAMLPHACREVWTNAATGAVILQATGGCTEPTRAVGPHPLMDRDICDVAAAQAG
jgi:hypothetical protein